MKGFFYPSAAAIIGVSAKPFNLGRVIAWNLQEFGFTGKIFLVGPSGGVFNNMPIHASLNEIEEPVDLAIILIPARNVPDALEECGRKGIRRVIIESGGFGEFGEEGRVLSDRLLGIAEKYDIRFIGPNCIGVMNSANGLTTPFTPMKNVYTRGGVSVIAQSGGVALSLLFMCGSEHLGYGKFATVGNKLNVDENDVLEYYIEDPETKVICMYLESIKDGRRLTDIARKSPKPIVMHKANIAPLSRVIAQSHTEALANDDQVVDAALRQAGVVRFRDMLSYLDFVKALQLPRMKGRNLAIVSRSGGHAVIAADAAHTYNFNLPPFREDFLDEIRKHLRADVIKLSNPLDLGDLFDYEVYVRIIDYTLQQDTVDGVLFTHTFNAVFEGAAVRKMLHGLEDVSKKYSKPLAVCVSTEHFEISAIHKEIEFPTFVSPERAIEALDRSIRYEKRRDSITVSEKAPEPDPRPDHKAVAARIRSCLSEERSPLLHESLEILGKLGLEVPEYRFVSSVDEIASAMRDLGAPCAAKVVATHVSHKSDRGGVVLGLRDEPAIQSAVREMMETFGAIPDAGLKGVLLQRMARRGPGSYELIIGGKRDPHFGPVVLVGHGGILVEALGKTSIRMAPMSASDIEEMIEEMPGAEILKGVRGLPPVDREALKDAIIRIADLMARFPEIDQIDVNPVIVSSTGAQAVDARIFVKV
jgi:acetyltransferase